MKNVFDKKRRYFFATHWKFIEGWSIEELNTIKELRETLNEIWAEWCSENNKKYFPLFDKLNEVSGNSFQD